MQVEVAILLSIISVAFSVFFGLKNNKRSDTKDIEERVRNDTKINVKLDSISTMVQELKSEISSIREEMKSYNERLVKVEESTKQAHHRLDGLEERLNGKDEKHE